MLDIRFIRENPAIVKNAVEQKCITLDIDNLLAIDKRLYTLKREIEKLNAEKNAVSGAIPKASPTERPALVSRSKEIGIQISTLTESINPLEEQYNALMTLTPTIPAADTPIGKSDQDNVVIATVGEKPKFDFTPLDHIELMEKNAWGEFKRISNICGSRTVGIKGVLVRLEMALWQMVIDKLSAKGFTPISVPVLANERAFYNTGHFPTERENTYSLPKDNLFLAGTAEVILNSLHADEIIPDKDLPILYAGFSPCFRREAGSAGKDVKGMFRVHQFSKVEQYVICRNDKSETEKWHQAILQNTFSDGCR